MKIAVAAHSEDSGLDEKTAQLVDELAKCSPIPTIYVGGYWGLMRRIVDEALKRRLTVVAILPIEREDVEVPEGLITVKSGCEYRCRSVALVRSADVLIALGGAAGTMIEVLMAYAMGKPTFVLTGTGLATDKLPSAFPDYVDDRRSARVTYSGDPRALARAACSAGGTRKILEIG